MRGRYVVFSKQKVGDAKITSLLQSRAAKRETLRVLVEWLLCKDAPLNATLQFSTPLANSISTWPEQHADITRKLKKMQQSPSPFGWDTEPVTGTEAIIEEAFVDVFCDLVYGGGWTDMKREDIDRKCNWALVRIGGCLGHRRSNYLAPSTDRIQVPSASAIHYFRWHGPTYIHERFPLRRVCATRIPQTLEQENSVHILLSGEDQAVEMSDYTEQAVVSHVPRGREVEFEGLLRGSNSPTKVISLGRDGPVKRDVNLFDAVSSRSLASTLPRWPR